MRIATLVAAALGITAVVVLGPVLAALAAVLGLLGSILHEALHYIAAVAVGVDDVTVGWDAIGPYVEYAGEMRATIQLAPALVAFTLAAWLTVTTGFPSGTTSSVLVGSFLLGLHSLSPTDYQPLYPS
ncbi:hypothetical protein [Halobacterium hubeiense]|uniref:hypothetical protein n=1 Tax=Halobacterium hubeiense TaxID=1407499 RepID=UPI003C745DE9